MEASDNPGRKEAGVLGQEVSEEPEGRLPGHQQDVVGELMWGDLWVFPV